MQILFIIFGFHIHQLVSYTTICETLQIDQKIGCNNKLHECFILEGDEEDYYKLKRIDKEVIQKSFTIPYNDIPIQIKMFKQYEQGMISKKLICSLFQNKNYYITCKSFDTLNYGENSQLLENLKIEIKNLQEEICDEMFQLDEGIIILFCLKQSILRQYSVSLKGDVMLMIEYDVFEQIQDQCKKKSYNQKGKNQFLITFFQCSKWKFLQIINQEIIIILEYTLKDYEKLLQYFPYVQDVQLCQQQSQILYLFEDNNYLQVRFGSNLKITVQFLRNENPIQKIVLLKPCTVSVLIIYQKTTKYQSYKKIDHQIFLNQPFEADNINFFSNYLFIQNQTQLILRIDDHLIQTYEILNTKLNFFEYDNLFYQIDIQKNLVQFYRYYPMSSFIEPKQQYIYIIQKLDIFYTQSLKYCFRMEYEDKVTQKKEEFKGVCINKDCQLKQEVQLVTNTFQSFSQNKFSFYINNNEVIYLSIKNDAQEDIKCYQRIKGYRFKSKTYLRSMLFLNYLVFHHEDSIYFHNCQQNKIEITINTNQFEVFQYQEDYYLIDKKNNQLKVMTFIQGNLGQIVLKNNIEIIRAQQIQQQLLLYLKNEKSPVLISKSLFQHYYKQLSDNLVQPEQILYYQEIGMYKFIQYPNIFACEFQEEVKCFKFSDSIIIQITRLLTDFYSIFAVQSQTNSILLYYTNFIELHLYHNYTLQEYQFSNPLKYNQITNTFALGSLAILTELNSSFFIFIFTEQDQSIELRDIIQADDSYFQILNQTLLYLKNGYMRVHYLNQINALIETNMSGCKNLFNFYQLTLKPTSRFINDLNLKLLVLNECLQLFPLKNSISLRLQQNENIYLKISEMFQGPIHNLTIIDNPKIYLKSPFQFIQQINDCNEEMLICIKTITQLFNQSENINIKYSFFVIIQEDKRICQALVPIDDSDNQIFWVSDYSFIWFRCIDEVLYIRLLQCSKEMGLQCKEIMFALFNFKIQISLSVQIRKSENLVQILNSNTQIYIYISNQNFTHIDIPDFHFDFKYVEHSENLFIALSKVDQAQNSSTILRVYKINFNGYVEIFSKIVNKDIQNLLPMDDSLERLSLISCRQNGNVITVNILVSYLKNFFIIMFQIDIQNILIIQQKLSKQIRNSFPNQEYELNYVNDDYLILNMKVQNATILFDLSEERLFYDNHYFSHLHTQITRINTTHFIFRNQSQFHLGIIQQYEIDLREVNDTNLTFILIAQNHLSDTQISINVTRSKILDHLNKIIILILLINIIFILLQLRTKWYRKIQKKQSRY
ncbi:unnamed protein product [Paramecium octaurelia]|uniref:Transmembrane protein n=1 Tax=Paramecium octaurelia TaxID=43137 RepID=A0A8S1TMR3_PAROT|nr:unnamed protein product [Paramecium octaurelia]